MNNMKKYLTNRYEEFWYDIYNIEKIEFKNLKLYIDYVEKTQEIIWHLILIMII